MTTTDAVVSGFSTLGYANATSLNVTTGFSTVQSLTADDITSFRIGATVSKDLNVGGATTVGGALTVTGNAYFNGNVDINGDLTYDEVNARNLNISGIATVGFATVGNMTVAGMTTTSLLNVGFGATMVKVQGTPANQSWYQLHRPCIHIRCRW